MVASSPQLLAERFGATEVDFEAHEPDYNVTPRALVPIVRDRPRTASRAVSLVRWGLVPSWAKDPGVGDRRINARAETVATAGSYKTAFARRRCIVPADAFYEWTAKENDPGAPRRRPVRQPYLVRRRDREPMAFAGLWEIWRDETVADRDAPGAWLRTCAIVTTAANALLAPIHDRMPAMLDPGAWDAWLDPAVHDADVLLAMLRPAPEDWLELYAVSPRVNKPENNDPDLLRPVSA